MWTPGIFLREKKAHCSSVVSVKRTRDKDNLMAQTPERALGHHCASVKTFMTRLREIVNAKIMLAFLSLFF